MTAVQIVAGLLVLPAITVAQGGSILIAGGGVLGREIFDEFVALAGGKDAPVVFIPSAFPGPANWAAREAEFNIAPFITRTWVHTRSVEEANSADFSEPLARARAVWFGGGHPTRITSVYRNTLTHKRIQQIVKSGGVVGGTSAGAVALGTQLLPGPSSDLREWTGSFDGLDLVPRTVIDTHVCELGRQNILPEYITQHRELIGIGLDEGTAVVISAGTLRVIGRGKAHISAVGQTADLERGQRVRQPRPN